MKIKTSELKGAALNHVVAMLNEHEWRCPWMLEKHGYAQWQSYEAAWGNPTKDYCGDWAHGGPIIDRERLCLMIGHAGVWLAYSMQNYIDQGEFMVNGPTPLIAAMRCYVLSKLGDEVEIPEALYAYRKS